MRYSLSLLAVFLGSHLCSCVGTRIVGNDVQIPHAIEKIATSPSGGEMADAIATALSQSETYDLEVLDTSATLSLLTELEIPSVRASLPENMEHMRARGVDAYLRIEMTHHLISEDPGDVNVRLFSTHHPEQCLQFTWHNARGGMRGSLADASMRKGRSAAADEIAAELVRRLTPSLTPNP